MKFVSVEKVVVESGLVKQEQDHLKAVNETLMNGMKLAERSYVGLPADQVVAARQADKNIISQQWKGQQQNARNVVMSAVKKATDAYRSEQNIDVIMPMQAAVSVAQALDVSADIIAKLKTTKLDFGTLPEITLKAKGDAVKSAK